MYTINGKMILIALIIIVSVVSFIFAAAMTAGSVWRLSRQEKKRVFMNRGAGRLHIVRI